MNLGDKLIEIRKTNKLSQEQFAEILGVTRQTVSNWENYKNYPDINTIIQISDKFDIPLDAMLKNDKKMIKKIDETVQKTKKVKLINVILSTIIFLIIATYCVLLCLVPDKVGAHKLNGKMRITCTYKESEYDYTLQYNKVFKYPLGSSFSVPADFSELPYLIMNKMETEPFKTYEEERIFIIDLLESYGLTCDEGVVVSRN